MASCAPDRLTALQRELGEAFFALEQRFFLTGGAALGGYYLGHRATEDLDLFAEPGVDLDDAARALTAAASSCGAVLESLSKHPDHRRFLARRGGESCVVDLVIDRAPPIDREKRVVGNIRLDTLREIAANKVCTLLSRTEAKDLMDLKALLDQGLELRAALADAETKDAGLDPATLAWVLESAPPAALLGVPTGASAEELDSFRSRLVVELRAIAYERASRGT